MGKMNDTKNKMLFSSYIDSKISEVIKGNNNRNLSIILLSIFLHIEIVRQSLMAPVICMFSLTLENLKFCITFKYLCKILKH